MSEVASPAPATEDPLVAGRAPTAETLAEVADVAAGETRETQVKGVTDPVRIAGVGST